MTAGRNQIARWWTYTTPLDDVAGGAIPSGTIVNSSVLLRIEPLKPTMALLEQGVETVKLFQTDVSYVAKDIQENDVLEVVYPPESSYLNKMFRVISVQHPSLRPNDPRSQVLVILRRWDVAHNRQP